MKKFIALLLTVAMMLALVACGGSTTDSTTAPAGESQAASGDSGANKGEAKVYRILSGSGEGVAAYEVMNAIVTRYQAEVNPDFQV